MAQYILKSALVEEIDNLIDKGKHYDNYQSAFRDGNNSALYTLKGRIDTLEVKEVDLEKTLDEWRNAHFHKNRNGLSGEYLTHESQFEIAELFFKLGMAASNKAQKGEEV